MIMDGYAGVCSGVSLRQKPCFLNSCCFYTLGIFTFANSIIQLLVIRISPVPV